MANDQVTDQVQEAIDEVGKALRRLAAIFIKECNDRGLPTEVREHKWRQIQEQVERSIGLSERVITDSIDGNV
jgi:hypothetical protein